MAAVTSTACVEVLIVAFGELSDENWHEEVAKAERELRDRAASFESTLDLNIEVAARNIGRGADWTVLALYFAIAAVIIPAAHRKIRENVVEWLRIYRELRAFLNWVVGERTALYPDEYLFLVAIEALSRETAGQSIEYKGALRLPEKNPDLQGREDLMFSFVDSGVLIQIAVSRHGQVLWRNTAQL